MSSENSPVVRPSRLRRVGKYFLIVVAFLAVAAVSAHFIWKYSGDSQWQLLHDKKGIQVYTMKEPGNSMKSFKGVVRVRSTLGTAVKLLLDPGVCELDDFGCYDSTMIQKVDEKVGGSGYYSFKWKYPFYFQPREYVVKATFVQDPKTKQVYEEVVAAPERVPADDCCLRVTQMRNTWRLTPLEKGQVEIEYVVNTSGGGFFPYILDNLGGGDYTHYVLSKMQGWLDNDRYKNAKVAFIAEK